MTAPPRRRIDRDPTGGREADALRPFVGQWVAQRDLEVLVAADTPQAVLAWLERYGQRADAMFRVPNDESEGWARHRPRRPVAWRRSS